MSRASETCEKYEVASGASLVEHFEPYIRLNLDQLGLERSLALRRWGILGKSCAGYQGKDSYADLLSHLHPLRLYCLAILPLQGALVSAQPQIEGYGLDSWRNIPFHSLTVSGQDTAKHT